MKQKLITVISLICLTAFASCDRVSTDTYIIKNNCSNAVTIKKDSTSSPGSVYNISPGKEDTIYLKSGLYGTKGVAADYLAEAKIHSITKETVQCSKDYNNGNVWITQKQAKQLTYTHTLTLSDADF